jgi:hypothetical protein
MPVGIGFGWVAFGATLAAWSYRKKPRQPHWWIGALFIVVAWPLVILGSLVASSEEDELDRDLRIW